MNGHSRLSHVSPDIVSITDNPICFRNAMRLEAA